MVTRVVNISRGQRYDIYIGRGSIWGNPFTHLPLHETKAEVQVGSRMESIQRYEEWVRAQPHLLARISELDGKRLGCYCAPLPCHGEVLVKLVREYRPISR